MKYRKANVADIPELIELRRKQLIDEGLPPVTNIDDEMHEYFLSGINDGSFVSWVAEEGSSIIATGAVCFYKLPPTFSNPTGRVAYITNIYTKNEYRRKGIASELLKLVVGEAIKQKYKVLRLHASHQAKSIYERFGFVDSEGYMSMKV